MVILALGGSGLTSRRLIVGAESAYSSFAHNALPSGPSDDMRPNVVEEHHKDVGVWGGLCTCPDGQEYWVGDYGDRCGSLACVGGTSGPCNQELGDWAGPCPRCTQDLDGNNVIYGTDACFVLARAGRKVTCWQSPAPPSSPPQVPVSPLNPPPPPRPTHPPSLPPERCPAECPLLAVDARDAVGVHGAFTGLSGLYLRSDRGEGRRLVDERSGTHEEWHRSSWTLKYLVEDGAWGDRKSVV